MATKLFGSVNKITLFQRFQSLTQISVPEEKPLEDWEKCLKWLKSLNIRSVKVPSLDSVNSDYELYHYLKVLDCMNFFLSHSCLRMGQSFVELLGF